MATQAEILSVILSTEKTSYIALIDAAILVYPSKKIQYEVLGAFMQKRIDRLTAIQTAVATKDTNADIAGDYTQFQSALGKIIGKDDILDYQNGLLGQTVNSDLRNRNFLKREIIELTKKRSLIESQILTRYATFNTDMLALKNILENLA